MIEFAVGLAILTGWTRIGAYVASVWLLGVAANLVAAGFYDVAVRDVVMSLAAFTLARLAELARKRRSMQSTASLSSRRVMSQPDTSWRSLNI